VLSFLISCCVIYYDLPLVRGYQCFGGASCFHHQSRSCYYVITWISQHESSPKWNPHILCTFLLIESFPSYLLHSGFLLGILFDLKMEASYSSETYLDFQRTTGRYFPEYRALYNHRSEKFRSYNFTCYFVWVWHFVSCIKERTQIVFETKYWEKCLNRREKKWYE
jgi:hypothetical protein